MIATCTPDKSGRYEVVLAFHSMIATCTPCIQVRSLWDRSTLW